MLYVFLVDTGTMMTFDINFAMASVSRLKTMIAKTCKIPEDKQVLLISGGENLDPDTRVCNYSAGTDTNPIFLFSKLHIESSEQPSIKDSEREHQVMRDMQEQVEGCLNMPPAYTTVVSRTLLSQEFNELATEQMTVCERLVHDQHLQQQGWAAVVANLEDITSAFKTRAEVFQQNFGQYLEQRNNYLELLKRFGEDLNLLAKIPLLPALLSRTCTELEAEGSGQEITLLQWISSKDSQWTLDEAADLCVRGLNKFDQNTFEELKADIQSILQLIDNPKMKEIKGLEERLCGLEHLMCKASCFVKEQGDIAQAFVQNQNRAGHLGDPSVLPDLCASHAQQLTLLLRNHNQLRDIYERCMLAKLELSTNLLHRIRWVARVENKLCELGNVLMIYSENLKRLKQLMMLVQQIHQAPTLYLEAVVEVVRRRAFSKTFLQWASTLSHQSLDLYNQEMATRKAVNSRLVNHFLESLFPGMGDYPLPVAAGPPKPFDVDLPQLVPADVELLRQLLPEMSNLLKVPSVEALPMASMTLTDSAVGSEIPSSRIPCLSNPSSPGGPHALRLGERTHGISSSDTSLSGDCCMSPGDVSQASKESVDHRIVSHKCHRGDRDTIHPIIEEQVGLDNGVYDVEVAAGERAEAAKEVCVHTGCPPAHMQKAVSEPERKRTARGNLSTETPLIRAHSDGDIQVPAREHVQSPDFCLTVSQEFVTADFFIDESMPSSYTESNGTSGAARFGQVVKSHHVVVAELQHQLEEKNSNIALLQTDLKMCRLQLQRVQANAAGLCRLVREVQQQLKSDVESLHGSVVEDRECMLREMAAVVSRAKEGIDFIVAKVYSEQEQAMQKAVLKAKADHLLVESQLELESHKLSDAHREIEVYREQLQRYMKQLDRWRQEAESAVVKVRQELEGEKDMIVRQLTLEHELELESLRQELRKESEMRDGELQDLKAALAEQKAQINLMLKEKQSLEETMKEQFAQERAELLLALSIKYKQEEEATVNQALQAERAQHQQDTDRLQAHTDKLYVDMKEFETQCETKLQQAVACSEEKRQQLLEEERRAWEQEKFQSLKELREELEKDHKNEIQSLRSRFKLAMSTTAMEHSPSDSSLEHIQLEKDVIDLASHEKYVQQLQTHADEEIDKYKKALEEKEKKHWEVLEAERQWHKTEMEAMATRIREEHQNHMKALKASLQAEKQVIFNEAVSHITMEKEAIIAELRKREMELLAEQGENRATISKLRHWRQSSCMEIDVGEPEPMQGTASGEESFPLEGNSPRSDDGAKGELGASVATLPSDSLVRSSELEGTVDELKLRLQEKDIEVAKLQQKVMELSASAMAFVHNQDKVSVLTCNVGDVILMYYDEKYETYTAFILGPVLHFFHTDCLEALGLKTAPGDSRKTWALAEVTDKEYCKAKKPQNRYKVPVGTRFYRLKAKPWDREAAARTVRRRSTECSPTAFLTSGTCPTARSYQEKPANN